MCGIVGIVGLDASLDRSRTLVSSDRGGRRWVSGDDSLIAWHAFAPAAWCEATQGDGPGALRDLIQPRTEALAVPAAGPALRFASSSR
jgi:hypothetical protein